MAQACFSFFLYIIPYIWTTKKENCPTWQFLHSSP